MDFIERIFGFAPDGGSGTWEMLLFAIPIAGTLLPRLARAAATTATRTDHCARASFTERPVPNLLKLSF